MARRHEEDKVIVEEKVIAGEEFDVRDEYSNGDQLIAAQQTPEEALHIQNQSEEGSGLRILQ